jgi:hypothetical protein
MCLYMTMMTGSGRYCEEGYEDYRPDDPAPGAPNPRSGIAGPAAFRRVARPLFSFLNIISWLLGTMRSGHLPVTT